MCAGEHRDVSEQAPSGGRQEQSQEPALMSPQLIRQFRACLGNPPLQELPPLLGSPLLLRVCSLLPCLLSASVCCLCSVYGYSVVKAQNSPLSPMEELWRWPSLSPGLDPGQYAHPPPGRPTVCFHRPLPPTLHGLSVCAARECHRACSWKLLPKGLCHPRGGRGRQAESHSSGAEIPSWHKVSEALFRPSLNTSSGSALGRVVKLPSFAHLPGDLTVTMAYDDQCWEGNPRGLVMQSRLPQAGWRGHA